MGQGVLNRNNEHATFNAIDGNSIDLATGHTDADGFHIVIDPNGSEGVIMVTPLGSDTPRLFPFFTGWNPILVKQVHVDAGNVATNVYWGK